MSDIGDSVNLMASLAAARSFLFAPGSDERKLEKALEAGADAVVFDLEDAVVPAEKERARALVVDRLAAPAGESLRLVRVNAAASPWLGDDVTALAGAALDALVLPKSSPEALSHVAGLGVPVVALVESAGGLRAAYDLACSPLVHGLMLGAVDLGLELGLEPGAEGHELLFARSSLVVDSAAANVRPPIDQVWVDIRDHDGLERDCLRARALGLRGKACIHPAQIPVVNAAFAPSDDELARAQAVVAAYEEAAADGRGAVALDGEMIDLPVVERARQTLANAKRSVLHAE